MAYQALYRAWRPTTFSEICGQEAVTQTLKRQVQTGHIGHAYLFCGTRGTGKTTAAKVLARAVNCLNPQDGDPCGACSVCLALQAENLMDVVEIDAASNNGVDEMRDLREKVKYPPAVTKYKVYIIDEVHMLSTSAFNALLKTLEEPPAHAVFILATTEPHKLPATILSRCQRYDFHRLTVDVITSRLRVVLEGIGRKAEEDALIEIAHAAEGAMRDALSLLDVCLSHTDGVITSPMALEALGSAGRGALFDFADVLIDFDARGALLIIDRVTRGGSDPQVFAQDAAAHLRGVLLAKTVGGDAADILEMTPEDAQRVAEQAQRAEESQLLRQMELFMRADQAMKQADRPRTMLELAAVRACHPEKEADARLSERLAKLEKMAEGGIVPVSPKPRPAPAGSESAPKPKPAAPAAAPREAPPPEYLKAVEVLQGEPSIRKFIDAMLFGGLKDGQLILEFRKKDVMAKRMLENKSAMVAAAFAEAFGQAITPVFRDEGAPKPAQNAGDVQRTINSAIDVFGRENVELHD